MRKADMSIFGTIMGKIFGHPAAAAPAPAPAAPAPDATAAAAAAAAAVAAPAAAAAAPVDVEAVLTQIAADKGKPSNWQVSIVDLLVLLDMDSSLTARKELADELNVHAGEPGTAEQNIALHKAVMQKLAENGGKIPDSLKN
jgi:3-oxoacyl-ACP reductase-like protein